MIPAKLKDTLNGHFAGLYGEVVTADCYALKTVPFQPDVVFDIGANVGVFSRYARSLFPKARIVAVEPDPENCACFRKFTSDANTVLIEKAIGHGQIYHSILSPNGAHEMYLSEGLGYSASVMGQAKVEKVAVPSIRLSQVIGPFLPVGKYVLKVDCEGAETAIWDHPLSLEAIRWMDFIAIELHTRTLTGVEDPEVLGVSQAFFNSLERTHCCWRNADHFWAIRRIYDNQT